MITKAHILKADIASLWKQKVWLQKRENRMLEYFNNHRDAQSGTKVLQTVQSTAYTLQS